MDTYDIKNGTDSMRTTLKLMLSTSLLTSFLPLMCCLVPAFLSFGAGLGVLAGNFEWLHPAQSYLSTFSVVVLGIAHYKNFKGSRKCNKGKPCENTVGKCSINSWSLWTVTSLVLIFIVLNYLYEF